MPAAANTVRASLPRACKRAADLPREPLSPQPKRHSLGNVITAAMARTRAPGNNVTTAIQRVFRASSVASAGFSGVQVASAVRYTPVLASAPTAQCFIPRNLSEATAQPDAAKWQKQLTRS